MGGQACVLYGAAQFSRDIDFAILASEENYDRLRKALSELGAHRIAVPPFEPAVLARGHAVHFRCLGSGVQGLRVDVMAKFRDMPDVQTLWDRRTTISDADGTEFNLLSVADLVQAKKTQREKDWPMISALVEAHFRQFQSEPNRDRITFWLRETRIPERISGLVARFPEKARELHPIRPLLSLATSGELDGLRIALDAEVRAEQEKDRVYWEPLRRELEQYRRAERNRPGNVL